MEFDYDTLFFLIFALVTIAAAIKVVTDDEIIHSVMYLALTFVGVAVVYFFLNAEYIGVIQILVYVGAVTVLFAFSIMLTRRKLLGGERCE